MPFLKPEFAPIPASDNTPIPGVIFRKRKEIAKETTNSHANN